MKRMELRKIFEVELQTYLKKNFASCTFMKVNRKEMKITLGQAEGHIGFDFLNNSQGYVLYEAASQPELRDFFNQISPPYKPNYPTNYELVMNTSMEIGFESFAPNLRGKIALPLNEEERKQTCEWIYTKVKEIYLPRVLNLMELKPETIDDVIAYPDYYTYPFLTILYLIKKHHLTRDELNMEAILSKEIIRGNSSVTSEPYQDFNRNLLDTYLA